MPAMLGTIFLCLGFWYVSALAFGFLLFGGRLFLWVIAGGELSFAVLEGFCSLMFIFIRYTILALTFMFSRFM